MQSIGIASLGLIVGRLLIGAICAPAYAAEPEAVPVPPGQAAEVSYGGRLYDNHWAATSLRPPAKRNPYYPETRTGEGLNTWRCVSCHGWDYRGVKGSAGQSSPVFTPIRNAAERPPEQIVQYFKTSPMHAPLVAELHAGDVERLALFVCCGQHDILSLIDRNGKALGDPLLGQDIYDNACMRCHQADGKAPLYGEAGDKSSLGWISRQRTAQAVHKIRNGVPGADMLSLRFLELKQIGDLLAYLQTLE